MFCYLLHIFTVLLDDYLHLIMNCYDTYKFRAIAEFLVKEINTNERIRENDH